MQKYALWQKLRSCCSSEFPVAWMESNLQHLHFLESTPRSTPILSELLRLLLQLLQPAVPPAHRGSSEEIKGCHYQLQFQTVELESVKHRDESHKSLPTGKQETGMPSANLFAVTKLSK